MPPVGNNRGGGIHVGPLTWENARVSPLRNNRRTGLPNDHDGGNRVPPAGTGPTVGGQPMGRQQNPLPLQTSLEAEHMTPPVLNTDLEATPGKIPLGKQYDKVPILAATTNPETSHTPNSKKVNTTPKVDWRKVLDGKTLQEVWADFRKKYKAAVDSTDKKRMRVLQSSWMAARSELLRSNDPSKMVVLPTNTPMTLRQRFAVQMRHLKNKDQRKALEAAYVAASKQLKNKQVPSTKPPVTWQQMFGNLGGNKKMNHVKGQYDALKQKVMAKQIPNAEKKKRLNLLTKLLKEAEAHYNPRASAGMTPPVSISPIAPTTPSPTAPTTPSPTTDVGTSKWGNVLAGDTLNKVKANLLKKTRNAKGDPRKLRALQQAWLRARNELTRKVTDPTTLAALPTNSMNSLRTRFKMQMARLTDARQRKALEVAFIKAKNLIASRQPGAPTQRPLPASWKTAFGNVKGDMTMNQIKAMYDTIRAKIIARQKPGRNENTKKRLNTLVRLFKEAEASKRPHSLHNAEARDVAKKIAQAAFDKAVAANKTRSNAEARVVAKRVADAAFAKAVLANKTRSNAEARVVAKRVADAAFAKAVAANKTRSNAEARDVAKKIAQAAFDKAVSANKTRSNAEARVEAKKIAQAAFDKAVAANKVRSNAEARDVAKKVADAAFAKAVAANKVRSNAEARDVAKKIAQAAFDKAVAANKTRSNAEARDVAKKIAQAAFDKAVAANKTRSNAEARVEAKKIAQAAFAKAVAANKVRSNAEARVEAKKVADAAFAKVLAANKARSSAEARVEAKKVADAAFAKVLAANKGRSDAEARAEAKRVANAVFTQAIALNEARSDAEARAEAKRVAHAVFTQAIAVNEARSDAVARARVEAKRKRDLEIDTQSKRHASVTADQKASIGASTTWSGGPMPGTPTGRPRGTPFAAISTSNENSNVENTASSVRKFRGGTKPPGANPLRVRLRARRIVRAG